MNMKRLGLMVCAGLAVPTFADRAHGALVLQLQAANYNAASGVWTDTSGNGDNATYSGSSTPTVVTGATPNGSAAVSLTGTGSLVLSSAISDAGGWTLFTYAIPVDGSGRNAFTGGSASNALEWDVYGHQDDFLKEYTADVAHGTGTVSTSVFSLMDLAVSPSGSSFNLNGASDGTGSGASFTNITRIGNNEGGGDGFSGKIAEIDIYNSVLTAPQIAAVEAQLTASYISPVPEPATLGLLGLGSLRLLARRRRLA
jgi:hypothetical protein